MRDRKDDRPQEAGRGSSGLKHSGDRMKGKPEVIERLNEALFLELGAINQY